MSISGNGVLERVPIGKKLMENTGLSQLGNLRAEMPETGRTSFGDSLLKAETMGLVDDLDKVAEKLFRFPSEKVLEEYRNAVGMLLRRAESMLEVHSNFSVKRGTSKFFIDRTRKGLRELEDVIAREGKRSRIMGITADIRGCLLSLVA